MFVSRRTFPLIKLNVNGMEDQSLYTIQLEFRVSDAFKYRFINGEWKASPRTERIQPKPIVYEHSDSPNFGHHWTKDSIAFSKLKLTNNESSKSADAVYLKSLMKYDPIVHIYRHDRKNVDDKQLVCSQFFEELQFIAVTAYQNEHITSLKIKFNPFAKAFLNQNKPLITIENNQVKTEPSKDYQKASVPLPSSQVVHYKQEPVTTNSSFARQSDLIQNWYNSRYSIDSTNQYYYNYQQQYFNPYIQNQSSGYYPTAAQSQYYPAYQPQQQHLQQHYYYPQNSSSCNSSKRSRSSTEEDDFIPYSSSKRANISSENPVSPSYYNEQTDESVISNDNYYQLNIQPNNSLYSSAVCKNESGYYTHSPTSIASVLDSNVSDQNETE